MHVGSTHLHIALYPDCGKHAYRNVGLYRDRCKDMLAAVYFFTWAKDEIYEYQYV